MNAFWAALFGVLLAWLAALLAGPLVIPSLRRLKFGQAIRREGPARHLGKAGTPTGGGLIFTGAVSAACAALLAFGLIRPAADFLAASGIVIGFGAVGFADDFLKVVRRRPLGLRAREKLLAQAAAGVALGLFARGALGLADRVALPIGHAELALGWAYPAFVALVVIGSANAVNITDGLDGLAAGLSALAYAAYAWIGAARGSAELAALCAAMVGALLGFLRFNRHPAQVFMGDTGAMALGAGLGAVAVLTRTELLLPLIGGPFVVETLSVILQVTAFRATGRRILLMSPLHHHFELAGWTETQVVHRFWVAGLVCAAAGVASLAGLGE